MSPRENWQNCQNQLGEKEEDTEEEGRMISCRFSKCRYYFSQRIYIICLKHLEHKDGRKKIVQPKILVFLLLSWDSDYPTVEIL